MFSRLQFKQDAKLLLKRRYWQSFLVCIIVSLLMGITNNGSGFHISIPLASFDQFFTNPGIATLNIPWKTPNTGLLIITIISIVLTLLIFDLVVTFFLYGPLQVGQARFFLRQRVNDEGIETLFSAFQPGYLKVCAAMMLKDILVSLGSILFVIPGIILSLAYELVPFIMAENPNISPIDALKLSRRMTNGFKWEIFVLKLSFLGWIILGFLCCGIGILFLSPYIMATSAEMYVFVRNDAIASRRINSEEIFSARKPDSGIA